MAPGDPDSDISSFEEWLSETAESRDASEQEIIDRMMSSYWIMDELTGMLEEDHPRDRAGDTPDRRESDAPDDRERTEDAGGSVDRELIELLNALVDRDSDGSGREEREARDQEAFRQELRSFIDDRERSPRRPSDREFTTLVADLREAIDDLEHRTAVGRRDDRPRSERRVRQLSEQVAALEEDLNDHLEATDVDDRLEAIEDRFDEDVEDLASSVAQLREAVKQLDARVDDRASNQQIAAVSDEISSIEEELSSRLRTLEADVDEELDSVEEILKYLLGRVDDLDRETDSLRGAYAEVKPVLEDRAEIGRLQEINDTANRTGIHAAECEACNGEVDIGLLRRPRCPHCDATFDGLSTRSRFWWTTGTLTTGDPGSDPLPTHAKEPSSERVPDADRESQVDADGSEQPDFDWFDE